MPQCSAATTTDPADELELEASSLLVPSEEASPSCANDIEASNDDEHSRGTSRLCLRLSLTLNLGLVLLAAAAFFDIGPASSFAVYHRYSDSDVGDGADTDENVRVTPSKALAPQKEDRSITKRDKLLLDFLATAPSARDRAAELIVDQYILDKESLGAFKSLDYALEIMDLVDSDGVPVGVKGRPHLAVGGVGALYNADALRRAGITHVVNWSPHARCDVLDGVRYLCVTDVRNCKDMRQRIDELDAAVDFMETARTSGGRAMSQCWNGRNRSVTAVAAYLMKYEGMDAIDAWRLVKRTRAEADPYQDSLYDYCRDVLGRGEDACDCFWDSFAEDYMNVQCERRRRRQKD